MTDKAAGLVSEHELAFTAGFLALAQVLIVYGGLYFVQSARSAGIAILLIEGLIISSDTLLVQGGAP